MAHNPYHAKGKTGGSKKNRPKREAYILRRKTVGYKKGGYGLK